ncbi:MAG: hypothetical protein Q8R11_02865 [bacterium]|nr:hypothetical protein [bacterium]
MLLAQLFPWGSCVQGDVATLACGGVVVIRILQLVGSLALLVFFIMALFAGFQLMTSGGDAKAVEKARGTLTHAVIGLVALVVAFLILQLIDTVAFKGTGISILNFSLP